MNENEQFDAEAEMQAMMQDASAELESGKAEADVKRQMDDIFLASMTEEIMKKYPSLTADEEWEMASANELRRIEDGEIREYPTDHRDYIDL